MIINLHDEVKVKLTQRGRNIYYAKYYQYVENPNKDVDAEGYSIFKLWELMHVFGNNIYDGLLKRDLPIETEIKIIK